MEMKGKKVIVTGGALRIGAKISEAFAKSGARVIVHYGNSISEAEKLVSSLGGMEKGHGIFRCDFTKQAELEKMAEACFPADILINNASVFRPVPVISEDMRHFEEQMRINFMAPLFLMRKFCVTGGKLVINILDERVAKLLPAEGSYELSKKSLLWATEIFAIQAAPETRVNAIAPGATLPPSGLPNSTMEEHRKKIPLRKTPAPEDVAEACIYIARNDIINGQTIFVDGGQHLVWPG